jgi:hypothetical protein
MKNIPFRDRESRADPIHSPYASRSGGFFLSGKDVDIINTVLFSIGSEESG